MKIAFFGLEDRQVKYFNDKIIGQDVEYHTESLQDAKGDSFYDAEILAVFVYSKVTKKELDKFKKLKFIATMSTGFDHIDLEECKERGIPVCNVPAYGDNTVAEHAFGLILNLSRQIHKAYQRTIKKDFEYEGLLGFDLKGKTLGVLGTGRIGQNSIRIAKGFSMNVIAYDVFQRPELQDQLGFKYVELDELLTQSDIITIHVPLLKETEHMINKETIAKMKKGAFIINTARGQIINTRDLINALESGHLGGAGIDVLEGELFLKKILKPKTEQEKELVNEAHELMKMPNVIVTPHLAFYSKEGVQRIMDATLDNLFDYIENRGLRNQVKQ